jgi:hypothetical protein
VVYETCSFVGSDLREAMAGDARFAGCDFSGARLEMWDNVDAEFLGCTFAGRLHDVSFSGRPLELARPTDPRRSRNAFIDNDFSACDLSHVAFRGGIDLDRQLLPSGDEYLTLDRFPERVRAARRRIGRWPDDQRRERSLSQLDTIMGGDDHQETYWARCDELDTRLLAELAADPDT